jgi:hypothetical protein
VLWCSGFFPSFFLSVSFSCTALGVLPPCSLPCLCIVPPPFFVLRSSSSFRSSSSSFQEALQKPVDFVVGLRTGVGSRPLPQRQTVLEVPSIDFSKYRVPPPLDKQKDERKRAHRERKRKSKSRKHSRKRLKRDREDRARDRESGHSVGGVCGFESFFLLFLFLFLSLLCLLCSSACAMRCLS